MNEMMDRLTLAISEQMADAQLAVERIPDVRLWQAGLSPRVAQGAVRALRMPTEAMLDAARDWSAAKYGRPIGSDAATGCWQAMLDAVLKATDDNQP